jgi:Domain of unknown function (DUF4276)
VPFYVITEGHGESDAVLNLLHRLQADLVLPPAIWGEPMRKVVASRSRAEEMAGLVRGKEDAQGLLLLRDDEDGCPRETGPELAKWLKEFGLPFPAAVVLFFREYETLFLPCVDLMAGRPLVSRGIERPGLREDASFTDDPETPRDAKGVISSLMPSGRRYKPTTDQLALTRMIDFDRLRGSGLPCFGTLERGVKFLLGGGGGPGNVFPIDRCA